MRWVLPGGMLERGESPAECIRREILEELGVELPAAEIEHVMTRARSYGVEHTFTAQAEFEVADVVLTEGQAVRWLTVDETAAMHLAYEDDEVLREFFAG